MSDLTQEELKKIKEIIGRDPNSVELGMFEIMWSEHCSYKSSKEILKLFPTESLDILVGLGDDAAIVQVTDTEAIAIGMESHNHPSAIEPVAGAATGVGGIIRDIISMGAYPIAVLDALRFGNPDDERSRYLFEHVVKGISEYGNCIGVPTLGGELEFDLSFKGNPLVNVVGVGLVKKDEYVRGIAGDIGSIILIGSSTGRDGIQGVSFASEELTQASEGDRPAVQIGDPFIEKLLIEATLEIVKTGGVIGCKDLGGGGLTCGVSEMAAKGKKGAEINIERILLREEGMTPYEIMLSESQERILFVIKKGYEKDVFRICEKYDLNVSILGKITEDGILRVKFHGKVVASIPAEALAEGPFIKRKSIPKMRETQVSVPEPKDYNKIFLRVLSLPNIASKKWVYQQYDHEVQVRTVVKPGDDASVLRIDNEVGIALTTDCNSFHTRLNPYHGGAGAVAEASRNIVSMGAKPLCVVDCLNFGNPEKPEQFWEFEESVKGMADALRTLKIPVVGGNVSFYNETEGKAINPSPVVGMVGKLDLNKVITKNFKQIEDDIILIGETRPEMGGSAYYNVLRIDGGTAPGVDFNLMKRTNDFVLELIDEGLINACHDCSNGGISVALIEMLIEMLDKFGAQIHINTKLRADEFLFSESHCRFIVSCDPGKSGEILELARKNEIPSFVAGKVTENGFIVNVNDKELINPTKEQIYESLSSISRLFGQ